MAVGSAGGRAAFIVPSIPCPSPLASPGPRGGRATCMMASRRHHGSPISPPLRSARRGRHRRRDRQCGPAVGLCMKTTFEAFARRKELEVLAYGSRAEGTLDKTAQGLAFTSIVVAVELVVDAADVTRAEEILRSAKDHCIVSNALKTPVQLLVTVKSAAPANA